MALAGGAQAQTWPASPIRLVVPFAPGGGADLMARILADPLSKRLGQPIVIENKPGGGATVGADYVAKAAARRIHAALDHAGTADHQSVSDAEAALRPGQGFHAHRHGGDRCQRAGGDAGLPVKSVAELIAYAKTNPGKLNYSSAGVGASSHLSGALLGQMAGIDIVHVPYRGSGPALQDLLAGNVQMAIDTVAVLLPHIQSGGVRALGVASLERNPTLPDLPPITDTLPGFDGSSINYISGPAGLPPAIVEKLNAEINAVLSDVDVAKRMQIAGFTPVIESPACAGAAHRRRAGEVETRDREDQIESCLRCFSTIAMAAATDSSTFRCVVSNSWASAARRNGAAVRERSRSSRRRISARMSASFTLCPAAFSSSARRRARSWGAATTKIFTSAPGAITVPMSRPSSTAPGGLAAKSRWNARSAARTSGIAETIEAASPTA